MALFACSFFSKSLCVMTKVMVILPTAGSRETFVTPLDKLYERREQKTLYLLHGMYEDETIWLRRSNVERYAQEENIAVIMPYGENSYYTDMAHGGAYFTYLTKELPLFIENSFHISHAPERTAIAGLSMGGYGAFLAALTLPHQYSAFASLSGALDMEALINMARSQGLEAFVDNIIGVGKSPKDSPYDLFLLAKQLIESHTAPPRCFLSCGTEDENCYGMNQKMKAHLETIGFPHFYQEAAGGHDWDFWDSQLRQLLHWFNQV